MKRRAYIIVDLIRSEIYGLNPSESNLASVLHSLITSRNVQVNGEPYFLADYMFVASICKLLPQKKDTIQRLYKRLEATSLIKTMRINGHVYFTPSDDLRDWGEYYDIESDTSEKNPDNAEKNPNTSEKNPDNAEKNPNTSEKNPDNAEKNPCLYINNNSNNINNKEKEAKNEFSQVTVSAFSKKLGLTPGDLNVRQATINRIDSYFEKLVFPIDDDEIKRMFFILCCSPKWRNKTIHALQMSLNKLQRYDKAFSLKLIETCIAGGWQGLVFEDTDDKYREYMKNRSINQSGPSFEKIDDNEKNDALNYMEM